MKGSNSHGLKNVKSTFDPHPDARKIPGKGSIGNVGTMPMGKGGGKNLSGNKGK
jgi:hypothetical protein